jgi:hypothetical protein
MEAALVQVSGGNTADRLEATAAPTEQAWLLVDIAISRRPGGDFVARVSFDDDASWAACRGEDAMSAFEGAVLIAHQRAAKQAQAEVERGDGY